VEDMPVAQLENIAAIESVRLIEEAMAPVLHDYQANAIVGVPLQLPPGLPDVRGKGQVIAVADTGSDLGSTADVHPAFEGRVEKLIPIGRAARTDLSEEQKVNDPEGHGTHVCGIIVGQEIMTSAGMVGGVVPEATVVLSSLLVDDRALRRVKIEDLFGVPYHEHGAAILSNSWAGPLEGQGTPNPTPRHYDGESEAIDDFMGKNPDALLVFSAGKDHQAMLEADPIWTPKPSVGSQAAAKNCITVGATGSTRIVRDPGIGKEVRMDPDQVDCESSRGPVNGRVKPDLVAPGYNIFSAHANGGRSTGAPSLRAMCSRRCRR
jgi:serine protease AprX